MTALRKYGVETTFTFDLFEIDGVDFRVDAAHASGDTKVMKDEGVEANTTNGFVDEGQGYSITLTATEMQTARGVVYVVDQSTKVWLDRRIAFETYGNASAQHAFDLDTAVQGVNLIQINGVTPPVDNLELMYNGVGYTDASAPASRAQVSAIGGAVGSGLSFEATEDNTGGAIKGATFVGSQTLTFTATDAEDGTYHVIDHTGNDIDIVYGFDVGGSRRGTNVTVQAFLNSNNDAMLIQAYDFVGAAWDTRKLMPGQNGSANSSFPFELLGRHTGTGADLGKIYIRFEADGAMTAPSLNNDLLLVEAGDSQSSIGYEGGAVWINTVSGTAGVEPHTNGTADRPSLTLADSLTLAVALNIQKYELLPKSSITLISTHEAWNFGGVGSTVVLNGQAIGGSRFEQVTITGIGTGADRVVARSCFVSNVTLELCAILDSAISGTFTMGAANTFRLARCISANAAASVFDFAAVGASDLLLADYKGSVELQNMAAGDTVSMQGVGTLLINANCTGGTLLIQGEWDRTDLSGGAVTITETANINAGNIIAEVESALATYDAPTNAEMEARTIPSADYFDPAADAVANVTLVATTTTNTDMRGTDGANTTVPDNATIAAIETDTQDIQSRIPAALISGRMDSDVEAVNNDTDAADKLAAHAKETLPVTFTGGTTTTAILGNVDGAAASSTNDVYIGRVFVFNVGTLNHQVAEITDYVGSTKTATISAVTTAVTSSHTARMI